MIDETETEQTPLDDAPEAPEAEAPEVEAVEGDDGLEEAEIDGETYRLPPAVKAALEAARARPPEPEPVRTPEPRRDYDAEDRGDFGTIAYAEQTFERFKNVDWDAWERDDPLEAGRAWRQLQQLKNAADDARGRVERRAADRAAHEQRSFEERVQKSRATLERDIKGWGPELATKLTRFALQNGYTQEELYRMNADARSVKMLHKAWLAEELSKKQKQPPAEPPKVVTPIRGRGVSPAASGPSDRQSVDAWMKARASQLRAS